MLFGSEPVLFSLAEVTTLAFMDSQEAVEHNQGQPVRAVY